MKLEFMAKDVSFDIVEGLLIALLRAEQAMGVGRERLFKRQIGWAFIKSSMSDMFHLVSNAVAPEEVSGGHGCAAKKDCFFFFDQDSKGNLKQN